jgi:23S rRNA pseudouridine2605 synthase
MKDTVRIDKYLANNGYCSRRDVESFLKKNNVTVNGETVFEHGVRINPSTDKILINGKSIKPPRLVYYMLNKPAGYISTVHDEKGRKTILSLIKTKERVYPIGRLDQETTGIILFTNDGDFANLLIHPRYHVPKTYEALINGYVPDATVSKLRNGIKLDDGRTQPADITIMTTNEKQTVLRIVLYEGKKRQIRRMCETLKLQLVELKRTRFGPVSLGKLASGKFRELTRAEIRELREESAKVEKNRSDIVRASKASRELK